MKGSFVLSRVLTKPSQRELDRKQGMLSIVQVKDNLRKGEVTYLAAVIEINPDLRMEVPDQMVDILKEFTNVVPLDLFNTLPPRRVVGHKIELEPKPLQKPLTGWLHQS